MNNKAVLHLNLIGTWYDMIESGIKKEEYRKIKESWQRVFMENGKIKIKGKYYHPTDVIIQFSNGYRKDRRFMFVECTGLCTGEGNEEWGAEPGKEYFVIKLGKKL